MTGEFPFLFIYYYLMLPLQPIQNIWCLFFHPAFLVGISFVGIRKKNFFIILFINFIQDRPTFNLYWYFRIPLFSSLFFEEIINKTGFRIVIFRWLACNLTRSCTFLEGNDIEAMSNFYWLFKVLLDFKQDGSRFLRTSWHSYVSYRIENYRLSLFNSR